MRFVPLFTSLILLTLATTASVQALAGQDEGAVLEPSNPLERVSGTLGPRGGIFSTPRGGFLIAVSLKRGSHPLPGSTSILQDAMSLRMVMRVLTWTRLFGSYLSPIYTFSRGWAKNPYPRKTFSESQTPSR